MCASRGMGPKVWKQLDDHLASGGESMQQLALLLNDQELINKLKNTLGRSWRLFRLIKETAIKEGFSVEELLELLLQAKNATEIASLLHPPPNLNGCLTLPGFHLRRLVNVAIIPGLSFPKMVERAGFRLFIAEIDPASIQVELSGSRDLYLAESTESLSVTDVQERISNTPWKPTPMCDLTAIASHDDYWDEQLHSPIVGLTSVYKKKGSNKHLIDINAVLTCWQYQGDEEQKARCHRIFTSQPCTKKHPPGTRFVLTPS